MRTLDSGDQSQAKLLLDVSDAKVLAETLDCPGLGPELERAVKQVDASLSKPEKETEGLAESTEGNETKR